MIHSHEWIYFKQRYFHIMSHQAKVLSRLHFLPCEVATGINVKSIQTEIIFIATEKKDIGTGLARLIRNDCIASTKSGDANHRRKLVVLNKKFCFVLCDVFIQAGLLLFFCAFFGELHVGVSIADAKISFLEANGKS